MKHWMVEIFNDLKHWKWWVVFFMSGSLIIVQVYILPSIAYIWKIVSYCPCQNENKLQDYFRHLTLGNSRKSFISLQPLSENPDNQSKCVTNSHISLKLLCIGIILGSRGPAALSLGGARQAVHSLWHWSHYTAHIYWNHVQAPTGFRLG